jgi:ATP-dependent Clp protease ATP-binding subunit ClpX
MAKRTEETNEPKQVKCKFCGKMVDEDKLIYGKTQSITICEDCLDICSHIFKDKKNHEIINLEGILKPTELKKKLDEYIIGQDRAKKIMSVAVYNHYKRVFKLKGKDIQKSNIMLIGSTGSGKTLIAQTISKLLDLPMTIIDVNSITSAGYVGKNVEDCLGDLVRKADGDIKRAEYGIVFLDEIDKLAKTSTDNAKDVGGEGVQQALLKILEGCEVALPSKKDGLLGGEGEPKTINTDNILFIASGAFPGIENFIADKKEKHVMGFGNTSHKVTEKEKEYFLNEVRTDEIIQYGLIPEFVGRFPVVTALHKLDEDSLMKILTEPKNSITKQYHDLLAVDGVELKFDTKAIKKIANLALKNKTGARSLKSILENSMLDIMYKAPVEKNKEIVITENDIKEEA